MFTLLSFSDFYVLFLIIFWFHFALLIFSQLFGLNTEVISFPPALFPDGYILKEICLSPALAVSLYFDAFFLLVLSLKF
jgi:hypothetical protein